jgi:hypothetical protein
MQPVIRLTIVAVFLFCIGASNALSETMIEMPLKNMVRVSDTVIQGRVVQASSRWEDGKGSTIWTDYVIKISDTIHGKTPGDNLVVTQQGGALEGAVLQVGSNPDLRVGDEVVLFLKKADFLKGSAQGDNRAKYTIVGVAQGAYYVVKEGKTETAFKDYARAAVLSRPDAGPFETQPPPAELLKAEVERLREALKRNPEDQNLVKRLRDAENLVASAPRQPRLKQKRESTEGSGRPHKEGDLGMKPPAPRIDPGSEKKVNADLPPDVAEREQALKRALEAQAKRFKAIAEPVQLDELKKRIRAAAEAKD